MPEKLHVGGTIKTSGLKISPLEVHGVHSLIADGTRGPALVTQRQVVEHAGPTEDVSTASDVSRHRRVQADGAGGHLMAVDTLWKHHNQESLQEPENFSFPAPQCKICKPQCKKIVKTFMTVQLVKTCFM